MSFALPQTNESRAGYEVVRSSEPELVGRGMSSVGFVPASRSAIPRAAGSCNSPTTLDLLVGWRVTDDDEAAAVENEMIARVRAHHGLRPFAYMRN